MSNFIKRMVQRNLGDFPTARPLFAARYAREDGNDLSVAEQSAPANGKGLQRIARAADEQPEEPEEAAPSLQRKAGDNTTLSRTSTADDATSKNNTGPVEGEQKDAAGGDLMPKLNDGADLSVQRRAAPSFAAPSGLSAPSGSATPAASLPSSGPRAEQRSGTFADDGRYSKVDAPSSRADASSTIVERPAGDLMPPVSFRDDPIVPVASYESGLEQRDGDVGDSYSQTVFDDASEVSGVSSRPARESDTPLLPPMRGKQRAFFEVPPLLHRPNTAPSPGRGLDQASSSEPAVRIHIGRIEVRSVSESAPAAAPAAEQSNHRPMSLEEYLKRVNGEAL